MAIKTIEYSVNSTGITPATEQIAGIQGDHKVVNLKFTISQDLYNVVNSIATDRVVYRFDVYDGEGGIWQSEVLPIKQEVTMELEERHTRFGGKVTIYLVITALSEDNKTQVELYNCPVMLKFRNRPDGIYKKGENHESVSGLAQAAKSSADSAAESFKNAKALSETVEQKLKNGEFDGVGIKNIEIIDDEMIVAYTNDQMQNLGSVKGNKGDKGDKGDKGEAAATDQTYNPKSENAQSGKAVLEAIKGTVPRKTLFSMETDEPLVLCVEKDTIPNEDGMPPDSSFVYKILDTGSYGGKQVMGANTIATRDNNANLWTGTPIDDVDCANKKYVDDSVVTDQTYLPTSENAQSGKAVAEAMSNIKEDKIENGSSIIINEGDKVIFDVLLTSDAPEHTPVRIYNKNYVGENTLIGQTFEAETEELEMTFIIQNIDSAGGSIFESGGTNNGGVFTFNGAIETPPEYAHYVSSELIAYIDGYDEYIIPLQALEVGSTYRILVLTNIDQSTDKDGGVNMYKHTIEKIILINETEAIIEEVKADGTINSNNIHAFSLVGFGWDLDDPMWSNNYSLNLTYSTTDYALKKYVEDLVGDISAALDELHNYAQAIIGGAK